MGGEFEEVLVEGQLFRRYTKRDNFPSCRFVEGKARAFTEISVPEKPKKGRLSRDTVADVKRNADIYTIASKNLKIELTKNLPPGFDWKASDVEEKLESNPEALFNCFPDWVSTGLKEGLMDILNQNFLLQKMSCKQLETWVEKVDRNLVVTATPKSWAIVFTDANTAEIIEVAEARSYFIVDDNGIPLGEPTNALEEEPAFLTITTTQRVVAVDRWLNVDYVQMTHDAKASEERLCNAVDLLLSDEGLGLVDSKLMNNFHVIAEGNANSSIKAFAKHIIETMKYGYPSWQTPEDRNKTWEYLVELEKNLLKLQELEQAGFTDTSALGETLRELVRSSAWCDEHMKLPTSNSFYSQIRDTIFNLDASQYTKERALFIVILEHYRELQFPCNKQSQEDVQTLDAIYTAGQQLVKDVNEASKSANPEDMAIVVNYTAKQLQGLIALTTQSSSVLPATSQKCSNDEYRKATKKLQTAGYKEVVSSATKFLEAVATVIVKGIFLAMAAIANSAPFILAPCTDPPLSPTCRRRQTEEVNWSSISRGTLLASKCSEQQGKATTADRSNNLAPTADESNSPAPAA